MLGENPYEGRFNVNLSLTMKTIQNLDYHRGPVTRTEFVRRMLIGHLAQLTSEEVARQEKDRDELAKDIIENETAKLKQKSITTAVELIPEDGRTESKTG